MLLGTYRVYGSASAIGFHMATHAGAVGDRSLRLMRMPSGHAIQHSLQFWAPAKWEDLGGFASALILGYGNSGMALSPYSPCFSLLSPFGRQRSLPSLA